MKLSTVQEKEIRLCHYQQFAARMEAELGSQPSFTLAALLAETRSPTSDEETETAVTPPNPPQSPAVTPHLPRALTPFVGRQQEITAVALSNLAHLCYLQGDQAAAQQHLAHSLQMRRHYHLPGIRATAPALAYVKKGNEAILD